MQGHQANSDTNTTFLDLQAAAGPNRSSTPTNVVYPVVEPAYTPPPLEISSTPLLSGPAYPVSSTAVASRTIVSETSLVEEVVEGEGDSPSKVCWP